jgi:hypothetical protein
MLKLIDYIIGLIENREATAETIVFSLRMLKRVLSVTSSYEHDTIIDAITGGEQDV